jgi:molybdopterin-guanine dinucleotide biosynthesis protein A
MGVYALILAGGSGERLGGVDKAQLRLGATTCLERAIKSVENQSCSIAISLAKGAQIDLPPSIASVPDTFNPQIGPLGGIFAGAQWVRAVQNSKEEAYLLVTPVDTPSFPRDFVERAMPLLNDHQVVLGRYGEDIYPVCGVWNLSVALLIDTFAKESQNHAIRRFLDDFSVGYVDYAQISPHDPFKNINKISDLLHFSAG